MIGDTIKEIRVSSLYIDFKLETEIVMVYFLLDNLKWYEIVISDGKSVFSECKNEPVLSKLSLNGDEFQYPIKRYTLNGDLFSNKITSLKKCLYKGYEDESSGFIFQFENENKLILFEKDDEIKFYESLKDISLDNYQLIDVVSN